MVKKQKSASPVTRQALLDAFCLLHATMPVNQITVSQLTKKAGVDRTTFYQYFLDLPDIYRTVETEFVAYILKERRHTTVNDPSFVTLLNAAYQAHRLLFTALFGPYGDLHFVKLLSQEFYRQLPEFSVATTTDPHRPYLIEYQLMTTISQFRLWLARGQDIPFEDLMTLTRQLYLHGFSSYLTNQN